MKLFESVILHRIKARKDKDGNDVPEKLVIVRDVARTIAKDERTALLAVAREIPEGYADLLDEVEIALRPF
jgi:hypothetical protein